jgi:hypothetical protein
MLAPELHAALDGEVRWVHQPGRVARGIPAHHRSHRRGLICDGKLLAHLPVIISHNMAHGTSHMVNLLMV